MSLQRRMTDDFTLCRKSSTMVEDENTGVEYPKETTEIINFKGFLLKKSEEKMIFDDKNKFFSTHSLLTYYTSIDKKSDVVKDSFGNSYEIVAVGRPLKRVYDVQLKLVEE